ncbi:MAG TPA: hypothetical protein VFZ87_00205 [Gemmatimonadales bacterium]
MLFRFGRLHGAIGWLLTLWGVAALAVGARGYLTAAPIRPGWVLAGLIAIACGTAMIRWARRARPD